MSEMQHGAVVNPMPLVGTVVLGSFVLTAVEALTLGTVLGPFATSFFSEVGKRLGGDAAEALKVRIERKDKKSGADRSVDVYAIPRSAQRVDVVVRNPSAWFEVNGELSDEAWLAMLNVNLNDPSVVHRHLKWDVHSGTWGAGGEDESDDNSNDRGDE